MRVSVMRSSVPFAIALGSVLGLCGLSSAEDLAPRFRAVVDKGLEYLAKNQARDGHWEAQR